MGRKNRSDETRERIVQAFIESVIEVGLEKSSMSGLGARMGLDRSSVHYYFRTREELIGLAIQRVAQDYVDRIEHAVGAFTDTNRPRQLVDFLYGSGFHRPDLSILIDEFSLASNRDPAIQDEVAGMYRAIEDAVAAEIDREFPRAPRQSRRAVTYAITQLLEGSTVAKTLGLPETRWRAAREATLLLLATLEGSARRPGRRR